jgi:serine/threonine-protein kinase
VSNDRSRFFFAVVGAALVVLSPLSALAGDPVPADQPARPEPTPDQKAQAQLLFEKGKAAYDKGKCDEAEPLLAESNRIDPGIGTLLYLSDCREQLGKTASAWAGFLEAAALAKARNQAEREKIARESAAKLEPKLSRLRIDVDAQLKEIDAVVKRNGVVVSPLSYGEWLPVDPGPQEIEAEAPGYKSWSGVVEVPTGPTRTEAAVPALEKAPEPEKPKPPTPSEGLTTGDIMRISGIAVGGVGVLSLGVGAGFGIHAIVTYDEALSTCEDENPERCTPRGVRLQRDASTSALVSTVTFSLGAAMAAGGALLFFLAPSDEPPPKVGVTLDDRGAFFTFGGTL